MTGGKRLMYTVTLSNAAKVEMLRAVLAYEGALRGLSTGAVLAQLIMEAADVDAYPESLRRALEDIERERLEEARSFVEGRIGARRSA